MTGAAFRRLMAMNTRLLRDVKEDILAADRLDDRRLLRHGIILLGDVTDDTTALVRKFYQGRSRAGRLGAAEERGRHWQEGSPAEILENMRVIAAFYVAQISDLEAMSATMDEDEARDYDRKRVQNMRELALRIQTGKASIVAKDRAFWTPRMEAEFKDVLEYRLDA